MCRIMDPRVTLDLDALDLNIDCKTVPLLPHTLLTRIFTYAVNQFLQVR